MAAEPMRHEQQAFLSAVFGNEQGYLFISTKDRSQDGHWQDQSFVYPLQVNDILAFVKQQDDAGLDVYMAAQLYKEPNRRLAKNVKTCPSAWSDLDTACPWGVDPEPNIVLETSPGRWHGFWRTVAPMPPADAEEISRRIAYAHHRAGADLGGWDLTQVLRIPGTHNHKPEYPDCPVVLLKRCDPTPIPRSAFAALPAAPKKHDGAGAAPDDDGSAPIDLRGVELEHWQKEAVPDRSAWAMRMVGILKENGLSDRLVEVALANHPIYLAKAREKWGNKESLIYDDIRRCIQHWRETRGPTVDFDVEFGPSTAPTAELTIGTPLEDVANDDVATWKVYDIADFLGIEFPPVEWRVEGFLRERAILFSFGAPGSIKTFVATDAALAIASGGRFLGRFSCQQGRVLIVQEDTLASDYQQAYLRPMMHARGLTGDDLRGHLFIAPQAEFSLDQNDRLLDLCSWLESYTPDLLILDAFYLMYSGKREDLLQVMKTIKKIRNRYGCSIWIIDHNRKGQGDVSGENPIDRLINGREKSAAVDVVMESRPVKGEQGSAFLEVLKLRGAKMPEAVRVTYTDGLITVDGEDEVSPKGAAQTVYEWLCREGASRTIKQIMAGVGLADRTVRAALSELHISGLVRPFGGVGSAKTWYGLRREDAEPEPSPSVEFDGFGEE
jgi:hypothetical protein